MRKISIIVFFTLNSGFLFAQNLAGYWEGKLNLGNEIRLGFNISGSAPDFSVHTDSPDQGVMELESSVENRTDSLIVFIKSIGAYYKGKIEWNDSTVYGNWIQGGFPLPLRLHKTNQPPRLNRPQLPKEPYPYEVREVSFRNLKNTITLSGTLTLPKDQKPNATVVMITGSGPQDRDETIMEHKPFLVIADHLTRNGIAVLRYDDHGIGKSEGDFASSTMYDFADDVKGAVKYLKTLPEIDSTKIGLLGHSEGGMVGLVVATEYPGIAFFISMAGPGVKLSELMIRQTRDIYRTSGFTDEKLLDKYGKYTAGIYKIISKEGATEKARLDIKAYIRKNASSFTDQQQKIFNIDTAKIDPLLDYFVGDWFVKFISFDPAPYMQKISCPVLAINGSKDLQVAAGPNLSGYLKHCKKTPYLKVQEFPDLNHMFQHCQTGSPAEYGKIEETISEEVLDFLTFWILERN